jgi:hypothetical protein
MGKLRIVRIRTIRFQTSMNTQQFERYEAWGTPYIVSTLASPLWCLDDAETLNWLFRYPEEGHDEDARGRLIWFSIAERNSYCDRGHYRVTLPEGETALYIDGADERPNYYMSLGVAVSETESFARWRILKKRAEAFPRLRTGDPVNWRIRTIQPEFALINAVSLAAGDNPSGV